MTPNPLSSVQEMHTQLDATLQIVLDTLAGALSSNAASAKAAVDSVVAILRKQLRDTNAASSGAIQSVYNTVINELQSASTISASLLDTVVSQLSPLSPGFSPASASTQTRQAATATAQVGPTGPSCIYGPLLGTFNDPSLGAIYIQDNTCSGFVAHAWRMAPNGMPTASDIPTGFQPPPPPPPPPPLTGPTGPLPMAGTWSILYQCAPWAIRAVPDSDQATQQALSAAGWSYGNEGVTYNSQEQADAYLASNSAAFQALYCPTVPPTPVYQGPGPIPQLSGPTCPPCPPPHVIDVAPAEGERIPAAGPCWDVPPFTIPKFDLPLAGVLDPVGSVLWCQHQPQLIAAFQVSGHLLALFADAIAAADPQLPGTPPGWFATTVGAIPLGIGKLLCDMYVVNIGVINSLMRLVRNILATGLELLRAVSCNNPDALVSLILARSLLRAFRRIRIGTDAGLWATLDLEVQWDQAEQIIGYLIKVVCPVGVPSSAQAMESYRKGRIGEPQYRCWMLMNGDDPDTWNPVYESSLPVPGVGEINQLLYRLRRGRAIPGKEFLDADYDAALHRAGYSEEYRQWIEQIRYRVYTLREIRMLLDTGIVQQSEIEDVYKDEGFDDEKSVRLAKMEHIIYLRRHEAEIQGYTVQTIARLWGHGVIDATVSDARMEALGYSDEDASRLREAEMMRNRADQARKWALKSETLFTGLVEKQFKEAVITPQTASAALQTQGCLPDAAASIVNTWGEEVKFAYLTSAIAAIKKGWDAGLLSSVAAEQALINVGVGLAAAQQRVREWLVNLSVSQNVTTAKDTLRFVAEGMISPIEAAARLHNMGWLPTDADVLIQEALNKLHATEVRHEAAQNKQVQAQAKAAAALVKQARAAEQAGRAALKRLTPLATLNKWLKEGLIGTDLYTTRMTDMGYPTEEINAYIADISNAKGASVVQTGAVTDLGAPPSDGTGPIDTSH